MMRRKYRWSMQLICFIGMTLLLVLILASLVAGKTITVDDDGGANYEEIQDALNNADPDDTIRVYQGTYHENIVIRKRIILVGDGSDQTTINGSLSESVIKITADGVTLKGFTITGRIYKYQKMDVGITIESDFNTIIDNACFGIEYGLYISGNNNIISNNTFSDHTECGIRLEDSHENTLQNNTCLNNSYGIRISSSNKNVIQRNTCLNNKYSGINLLESNNTIIRSNTCWNNSYGVYFTYSNNSTLDGNSCFLNDKHGIFLSEFRDGTIENNTCSSCNSSGISLSKLYNCTILYNTCSTNRFYGISISNSHNSTISNNICWNNSYGIRLESCQSSSISNNTISSNNVYGIQIHLTSLDCTLKDNILNENGIFIDGTFLSWNSLSIDQTNTVNSKPIFYYKNRTNFTLPKGAGQVILANCTWTIVEDQDCRDASIGILVGFSSHITLRNNIFSSNNRTGISLHNSDNCTITNNICSSNGGSGISLRYSSNCTISDNTCTENHNGFYIFVSRDNALRKNTITGNMVGIQVMFESPNNKAHNNDIFDNSIYGIDLFMDPVFTFDARNNWWGSGTGPYHSEKNPRGKGDFVNGNVLIEPWSGKPDRTPLYLLLVILGILFIVLILVVRAPDIHMSSDDALYQDP